MFLPVINFADSKTAALQGKKHISFLVNVLDFALLSCNASFLNSEDLFQTGAT